MNFSSQFIARAKELKEEASRLHEISKKLRLKSIELKTYNRFSSNMGRLTSRRDAIDSATVSTIETQNVESANPTVEMSCE